MDVTELHDEENLLLRQTLGMGEVIHAICSHGYGITVDVKL